MRARPPGVSNCDTGMALRNIPQARVPYYVQIPCKNHDILLLHWYNVYQPWSRHLILPLYYRTATALFVTVEFSFVVFKTTIYCFLFFFFLYCITQSTETPWLEYSFEDTVIQAEACLWPSVVTLGYCV